MKGRALAVIVLACAIDVVIAGAWVVWMAGAEWFVDEPFVIRVLLHAVAVLTATMLVNIALIWHTTRPLEPKRRRR